jgi:hypothetical protein
VTLIDQLEQIEARVTALELRACLALAAEPPRLKVLH